MGKFEKLIPVSLKKVRVNDNFWSKRMNLVKDVVIPYQWNALNDRITGTSPSHAIENFRIAAGEAKGEFGGYVFQDSDLAKWLEAVSYTLITHPDQELERLADGVIDLIAKAQQEDGYLNTYFTIAEPEKRWTNLRDCHELYCAGHMMEAAVAYYEATGKRKLLDVMCRFADHIESVFGSEPGKKRGYPGHPEIELALVKLYRATGKERYLKLSKYFIDERGQKPHYFDIESKMRGEARPHELWGGSGYAYGQAHSPVREQTTAEGHAVRAMYLYSGMADVAAETGDETLLDTCKKLWKNVTQRRMYITGGIGSSAYGEAFTFDYDLPNDTAYAETCAAIGLVLWSHRMLHLDVDSQYADVMERALYNGVLSGISLDGKKFFYVNPLEVVPESCKKRHDKKHVKFTRQGWFSCACCPPNIARLLASIGQYFYSRSRDAVYVHLYASSVAEIEVAGQKISLIQETDYPWGETVEITIWPEQSAEFTLALRIPGWCRSPVLRINGEDIDIASVIEKGYVKIKRVWGKGDKVELILPMPVERIQANPNVRMNAGKVAIQRGPVVYCLEEVDNGPNLSDICLPRDAKLVARYEDKLLGGVVVITGEAMRSDDSSWGNVLYRPAQFKTKTVTIKAVPYSTWANRRPGEMLVWIRQS